jgi:hypothetical protein
MLDTGPDGDFRDFLAVLIEKGEFSVRLVDPPLEIAALGLGSAGIRVPGFRAFPAGLFPPRHCSIRMVNKILSH